MPKKYYILEKSTHLKTTAKKKLNSSKKISEK
jgi:hypothetical protein